MRHQLGAERLHYAWDNSIPPQLEVESGDVVTLAVCRGDEGYFTRDSTASDVLGRVFKGHPLTGPVYVKSAQSGDALEIEILELLPGELGYTLITPGLGLLS